MIISPNDYKMIGVNVPQHISQYLVLWGLAKGTTKTSIINPIIESFVLRKKQIDPESRLVHEISERVRLKYFLIKTKTPDVDLLVFKQNIEIELQSKGVTKDFITQILKEIK